MMSSEGESAVCRAFFGEASRTVAPLQTSGYSGSRLLLVTVDGRFGPRGGAWVVKSFGPSASPARASWVHSLMRHLRDAGIDQVPAVLGVAPHASGMRVHGEPGTILEDSRGLLWEAVRFLPGRPVESPDAAGRAAAMRFLAGVHLAAATLMADGSRGVGVSRGLAERIARAAAIRVRPWRRRLAEASLREVVTRHGEEVVGLFERAIVSFERSGDAAVARIAAIEPAAVECQPVLRDVWSGQLLFEGNRVSGLVDFHAAGIDTVATDLARLLGSWRLVPAGLPPDRFSWDECLAAYAERRPLGEAERGLVPLLHHAGVIVAIDNWFRWLVEEQRTFPDTAAVNLRLGRLVTALPESIDALPESIDALL